MEMPVVLSTLNVLLFFLAVALAKTIAKCRKRKAAVKVKTTKKNASTKCGTCKKLHTNSKSIQNWICCNGCDTWYHTSCEDMDWDDVKGLKEDEKYKCLVCQGKKSS